MTMYFAYKAPNRSAVQSLPGAGSACSQFSFKNWVLHLSDFSHIELCEVREKTHTDVWVQF
jgi:hypothetical protein